MNPPQQEGPGTTVDSAKSGRLVVDAGARELKAKKKKSLQERVRQQSMSPEN